MEEGTVESGGIPAAPGSPWVAPVVFTLVIMLGLGALALFGRLEASMQPQVLTFKLGDFPPESVTYVDVTQQGIFRYPILGESAVRPYTHVPQGSVGFFLVRHDGRVRALLARAHQRGGAVIWRPDFDMFYDTWFGSTWNLEGRRTSGPTPRGLDGFPVTVKGEEIEVDISEAYCAPAWDLEDAGPPRRC